jgi:two-component system phosphate regulon response regulator PhoB
MATILVADADPGTAAILTANLPPGRHRVVTVASSGELLSRAKELQPDLVLLELELPGSDGLEAFKRLRRDPATEPIPVVIVSVRTGEIDRVLTLELGAEDYVTKPFSVREFLLRLKRPLSRPRERATPTERSDRLIAREIEIDVPRYRVTAAGQVIKLTPTEFDLLRALASNSNRVLSRNRLLEIVWRHENPGKSRTVDTHIRRLRAKLGSAARCVDTVRGVGYRFNEE